MLSRPHPASFARALAMPDGEQAYRSRHHREFLDPAAGPRLLADDAAWVRTRLARNGVPEAAIAAHLSVIGNPPAMAAALAWYRARGTRQAIGPTKVPILFIWGDADDIVGGRRPRAPASSSPPTTNSPPSPASATTPPTRSRAGPAIYQSRSRARSWTSS
jgi:pimeloyl-ACP methyl ester carboxylesterase